MVTIVRPEDLARDRRAAFGRMAEALERMASRGDP
jgi:hypothetical protein